VFEEEEEEDDDDDDDNDDDEDKDWAESKGNKKGRESVSTCDEFEIFSISI